MSSRGRQEWHSHASAPPRPSPQPSPGVPGEGENRSAFGDLEGDRLLGLALGERVEDGDFEVVVAGGEGGGDGGFGGDEEIAAARGGGVLDGLALVFADALAGFVVDGELLGE